MPCPHSFEYNEAMQNLATTAGDEELRSGEPALNAMGLPSPCSGSFADVYKVHCPQTGNTWAVKCFTKEVRGRADATGRSPSTWPGPSCPSWSISSTWSRACGSRGAWQPVVKMRWVEGFALHQFVGGARRAARQPAAYC